MKTSLALLLTVLALLVGCKNPEVAAYRSIGSIAITADLAMNAWGDYVRAGLAKPEQEQRVRDAYYKYQIAMSAAEKLVIAAKTAPDQQPAYQTALLAVGSAASEIVALVESFTGKKLV